jgi:hypothetical protein
MGIDGAGHDPCMIDKRDGMGLGECGKGIWVMGMPKGGAVGSGMEAEAGGGGIDVVGVTDMVGSTSEMTGCEAAGRAERPP